MADPVLAAESRMYEFARRRDRARERVRELELDLAAAKREHQVYVGLTAETEDTYRHAKTEAAMRKAESGEYDGGSGDGRKTGGAEA